MSNHIEKISDDSNRFSFKRLFKQAMPSILVLSAIAFVCVTVLVFLNNIFTPFVKPFDEGKLREICPAESYKTLSEEDLSGLGADLTEFQSNYNPSNQKIINVYLAEGGENDGKFIIESSGSGNDGGHVVMLTAYTIDNEVFDVTVLSYDTKNTYWKSHTEPHLNEIYQSIIGKSGSISFDDVKVAGATFTSNGIARAVNIASDYVVILNGGAASLPGDVAENLKKLVGDEAVFQRFNWQGMDTDKLDAVYYSDQNDVVFQSKGSGGEWGNWTLLVNLDIMEKKVISVLWIDTDISVNEGTHDASALLEDGRLTTLFRNKRLEDIDGMNIGAIVTGATESVDGLKLAVKNALSEIDGFMTAWIDFAGGEDNG